MCTCPEMSAKPIQSLGHERFYIRSASNQEKMYLVDLGKDCSQDLSDDYLIKNSKDSCNCPDWPRAQLCKHIAAIARSREIANQTILLMVPNAVPQECETSLDSFGSTSLVSDASTIPILENLISVSRDYLSNAPPSSPGTVHSLQLVELHLTAVLQTSQ